MRQIEERGRYETIEESGKRERGERGKREQRKKREERWMDERMERCSTTSPASNALIEVIIHVLIMSACCRSMCARWGIVVKG